METDDSGPANVDVAFNAEIMAYKTGRKGRQEKAVIRVRVTDDVNSKTAEVTMPAIWGDPSGAGQTWSTKEATFETEACRQAELVIVVGEVVGPDTVPTAKLAFFKESELETGAIVKGASLPTLAAPSDYDPGKHYAIETTDSRTVVVRLVDAAENKMEFGVLANKEGGLCGILPLPQEIANSDTDIFFYREWVGNLSGQKKARSKNWKDAIHAFATEFIESREFMDAHQVGQTTKLSKIRQELNPEHKSIADEFRAVALYRLPGDTEYLQLVELLAKSLPGQELAKTDADLISPIRNIICGRDPIDLEEARETATACNRLWFPASKDSPAVTPLKIEPYHILKLAHGLRAQALGQHHVPEHIYRAFITNFCITLDENGQADDKDTEGDDDGMDTETGEGYEVPECPPQLKRMIIGAYRGAFNGIGDGVYTDKPAIKLGDSRTTLLSLAKANVMAIDNVIRVMRESLDNERNELGEAVTNLEHVSAQSLGSIKQRISEACLVGDLKEAKEGAKDLVKLHFLRKNAQLMELEGVIKRVADVNRELIQALDPGEISTEGGNSAEASLE